ncbi:MAG: hypothetical protein QOJ35_1908, partial [Solirubrobacteraceae bacterium]|nr:hypothetical protein [Solirubrobacteraceae bacterium]
RYATPKSPRTHPKPAVTRPENRDAPQKSTRHSTTERYSPI